jgi:hypothetical protein
MVQKIAGLGSKEKICASMIRSGLRMAEIQSEI